MSAPEVKLSGKGVLVLTGLAILTFLAYEFYKHRAFFDPTNPANGANRAFNAIYQDITGSSGSLGSDIYGWFHANPSPTGPAVPMCFKRDATGALVYVDGVIQEVPCADNPPGYQSP